MKMENLPVEKIIEILIELPFNDLIRTCSVNVQFNNICQSDYFWIQKIYHDYGLHFLTDEGITPKNKYIQLMNNINQRVKYAIQQNNTAVMDYYLNNGANINVALLNALRYMNDHVINHLLNRGAKIEELLIKTPDNMARLKHYDPQLYTSETARIVQYQTQPIVFDLSVLNGFIKYLYPKYIKNILVYRNNVYVAPLMVEDRSGGVYPNKYPYVYLKDKPFQGKYLPYLSQAKKADVPYLKIIK